MNTSLQLARGVPSRGIHRKVLLGLMGAIGVGMATSAQAQYFDSFWLSSLDLDEDWFENWSGEIEAIGGTKIPISVYIEGEWGWRDATGAYTSDGLPSIAIGSYGNRNWNDIDVVITIDAPVSFIQLKLDDFDFEDFNNNEFTEWVQNINDTLGAPSYVYTDFAEVGAEMVYIADENNGTIRHVQKLNTSQAGIGYAVWENAGGTWDAGLGQTTISFTVSKTPGDTDHWILFDLQIGNPAPVPEPSGLLLAGAAGATLLLRRKRKVIA